VSEKYEDGIWFGRYSNGEGDFGVRFLVKEQSFARRLPDGTYCGVSCTFLPLHRVADLEGRPVVDEGVVEAIVGELPKVFMHANGQSTERNAAEEVMRLLNLDWTDFRQRDPIVVAIGKHLDMERKARITPLPEPAERPIVDLRKFGAFPCWEYLNGDEWTCYPSGSGHTRIRHRDGYAIWSAMSLNETLFTRTPPTTTLPPEQERLVGPIARKLGKTETEVRDAIREVQGAGA
jgi:hypothetical protein